MNFARSRPNHKVTTKVFKFKKRGQLRLPPQTNSKSNPQNTSFSLDSTMGVAYKHIFEPNLHTYEPLNDS